MVGVGATHAAQPNHRGSIMGTEQKVAVVSGASQGIGAGLVKAFRDRNYRVVANSRSIKPASDEDILTVAGDIANPATAKVDRRRPGALRENRYAGEQCGHLYRETLHHLH